MNSASPLQQADEQKKQNRRQLSPRMASSAVDQARNEATVITVKSSLTRCCKKARTDNTESQRGGEVSTHVETEDKIWAQI